MNNEKKAIVVLMALLFAASLFLFVDKILLQEETKVLEKTPFEKAIEKQDQELAELWKPADINAISDTVFKKQVLYGKDLIANTSKYLGPNGSVLKITNGMNCQNCHLDAGTKAWGNNYGAVFSTYPKVRARSGKEENLTMRINDCLQRSLNGKALDANNKEMLAMIAYIEYIGKDVIKGEKPLGSGIYELPFLERAASPEKGKIVYEEKCKVCHQANGEGILNPEKTAYTFPPLWGKNSYNIGAGLYRLSRLAGYVKYNMPQGVTYTSPQLTDEQAWDVAAYINTQPRPTKDLKNDWPDISKKPIDHPFGPFSDSFTEIEHKLGPFKPIKEAHKK